MVTLSPSDELSQDPTPSSTCASPELPPHAKQQPVQEEETDKKVSTNVVTREDSSVENGMSCVCVHMVCVCVCVCACVCVLVCMCMQISVPRQLCCLSS